MAGRCCWSRVIVAHRQRESPGGQHFLLGHITPAPTPAGVCPQPGPESMAETKRKAAAPGGRLPGLGADGQWQGQVGTTQRRTHHLRKAERCHCFSGWAGGRSVPSSFNLSMASCVGHWAGVEENLRPYFLLDFVDGRACIGVVMNMARLCTHTDIQTRTDTETQTHTPASWRVR